MQDVARKMRSHGWWRGGDRRCGWMSMGTLEKREVVMVTRGE